MLWEYLARLQEFDRVSPKFTPSICSVAYNRAGGGGQGAECPHRLLTGKFFTDVSGKKREGKKVENWEEKKENER